MEEKMNFKKIILDTLSFILATILGFVSVVLPPYVIPNGIRVTRGSPVDLIIFPIIATASANFALFPTIILMFITGCVLGFIRPHIWWFLGLSTMALFPIADMVEMSVAPTSHNLWPIQFILDAILASPAILGAFMGSRIKNKMRVRSDH
jgi:hypothetical protein